MLPPLDIEIPNSTCWKEAAALRDVADTDRLSPTGEDVTHVVTINVSCLSGITAERRLDQSCSSCDSEASAAPQQIRAMVSVFRRCQALGSSRFSEPLSLSSSPMFADDSTNRYVAMWSAYGQNKINTSTVSFEVPLRVSNGIVENEDFDLIVFLADHSKQASQTDTVVAYPVGLGTFVLGDQCQSDTKAIDLRIHCLDETSGFPAVEVQRATNVTSHGPISFSRTIPSSRLKDFSSTYRLDSRGGGFVRTNVDFRRVSTKQEAPVTSTRENEETRSTDSPGELSPEEMSLHRTSQLRQDSKFARRIFRKARQEKTKQPTSQDNGGVEQKVAVPEEGEDEQNLVAARIVAKLKFPSRSSRKQEKLSDNVEIADNLKINKELNEEKVQKKDTGLRYQIGNKGKKETPKKQDSARRLVDVEHVTLLSFDDDSLMEQLRQSSPGTLKLKRSDSGVFSTEEATFHHEIPNKFSMASASALASKIWEYLESLVSCGNIKQTSDASVAGASAVSLVDTWGTCEEDDRTLSTLEKSVVEDDDGFLADIANTTWSTFDKDVNAVKSLLAPQGTRIKPKRGRSAPARRPARNEYSKYWGDFTATAQRDFCQRDAGTISSVESPKSRRTRKSKYREHWV